MVCRIAERFGCRAYGDVLTGFKWIGSKIDEIGPEKFVFGFEEAHGYLAGTYARDKDGAVAAMLLAELAAECKASAERCTNNSIDCSSNTVVMWNERSATRCRAPMVWRR